MRKVVSWDKYFMEIANVVSSRSKDPNTQVGAVIVNKDKKIISTGYNGFPCKMFESEELWQTPIKYQYVIHAESNAICHANTNLQGSVLYVNIFPCIECAKLIINSGISKVVYNQNKYFKQEVLNFLIENQVEVLKIEI